MWPDMLEFHSVSAEIRERKREEDRIKAKPKSADKYAGWPN